MVESLPPADSGEETLRRQIAAIETYRFYSPEGLDALSSRQAPKWTNPAPESESDAQTPLAFLQSDIRKSLLTYHAEVELEGTTRSAAADIITDAWTRALSGMWPEGPTTSWEWAVDEESI